MLMYSSHKSMNLSCQCYLKESKHASRSWRWKNWDNHKVDEAGKNQVQDKWFWVKVLYWNVWKYASHAFVCYLYFNVNEF